MLVSTNLFGSFQLHRQAEDYTSSCATEIECRAWSLGEINDPKNAVDVLPSSKKEASFRLVEAYQKGAY